MRILLLQLDGKLPNIALMRIAHHLRAQGHHVEYRVAKKPADLEPELDDDFAQVFASAIFDSTAPLVARARAIWPRIMIGGTGVDLTTTVQAIGVDPTGPLDYSDHPGFAPSIGFSQRGCRLRCEFCVVPRKEGRPVATQTINEIWRGDPHPRQIVLLDNDFFGVPQWRDRIRELRDGNFRVCFSQGINARMLNDETAEAIASVDYRDNDFDRKRIYTAWDNKDDERTLFRGLEALARAGVKPDHMMVYMLIGFWAGETDADREHRRAALRAFGARPYPMPFKRPGADRASWRHLKGYQRFVVQRTDLHASWDEYVAAGYEPRELAKRRVHLPMLPGVE